MSIGRTASVALPSTWTRLRSFFTGRCSEYCCRVDVAGYAAVNLLMVALALLTNFGLGCEGHKSYAVAKVGGYLLDLNFGLMPIPMLRNVRECFLHNRNSLSLGFFSDPVAAHIRIAVVIRVGVVIHLAGHAWHYLAMEGAEQEQGPCSQKVYEYYRGPTGIALLLLLGLMYSTAHPRLRRAEKGLMHRLGGFSLFHRVHGVYKGVRFVRHRTDPLVPTGIHRRRREVYVLLWFHGRQLTWGVLLGVGFLYYIDRRVMEMFPQAMKVASVEEYFPVSGRSSAPMQGRARGSRSPAGESLRGLLCRCLAGLSGFSSAFDSSVVDTNATSHAPVEQAQQWCVLHISLEKLVGFTYEAGQYIRIRWEGECHPFTISSAPEDEHVTLHIQCKTADKTRDWCERLRKYLTQPAQAGSEASLQVMGPFSAPAVQVWGFKTVLLVAGGIGVTPMMSILSSLAHRSRSNRQDLPTKVYARVSASTKDQARFFEAAFENIASGPARERVDIRIHITDKKFEAPRDLEQQPSNFSIVPGRLNLDTVFAELDEHEGPIGVFVCGPQTMVDKCGEMCENSGTASVKKFVFRPEQF